MYKLKRQSSLFSPKWTIITLSVDEKHVYIPMHVWSAAMIFLGHKQIVSVLVCGFVCIIIYLYYRVFRQWNLPNSIFLINRCYSYVGNIKRDNGQDLNLGEGCLDVSISLYLHLTSMIPSIFYEIQLPFIAL